MKLVTMARTLQNRINDMLQADEFTDVTCIVGDQEFQCHRVVLGSHEGLLKETLKGLKNKHRLHLEEGLEPHVFKNVLKFLYEDQCHLDAGNHYEMLHAATFLKLTHLENVCIQEIRKKVNEANVGFIMLEALNFGSTKLQALCMDYFQSNTAKVLHNEHFLELPREVLLSFLEAETVDTSEGLIFEACVNWAKRKCLKEDKQGTGENLAATLGDVLGKIRFYTMTRQDFIDRVLPTDILSDEKVGRIVKCWKGKVMHEEKEREITNIRVNFINFNGVTTCKVSQATTVYDIKHMKIWSAGRVVKSFPGDFFTVSANNKELADVVELSSLARNGEQVCLRLYSRSYKIIEDKQKWQFVLKITEASGIVCNRFEEYIKSKVTASHGHPPEKQELSYRNRDPGAVVSVRIT